MKPKSNVQLNEKKKFSDSKVSNSMNIYNTKTTAKTSSNTNLGSNSKELANTNKREERYKDQDFYSKDDSNNKNLNINYLKQSSDILAQYSEILDNESENKNLFNDKSKKNEANELISKKFTIGDQYNLKRKETVNSINNGKEVFTRSYKKSETLNGISNEDNSMFSRNGLDETISNNNLNSRFNPENQECLQPGDLIYDGKITIIEILGKGAQGHVYLGEIKEIDKFVAVKRHCLYDVKMNDIQKILDECETFKDFDHPHILKYYDLEVFNYDNFTVINLIIEYIDGINLREYIDLTKGNCTIDNIKIVGRCILEGLAYLHSNNLIHRDLKVLFLI